VRGRRLGSRRGRRRSAGSTPRVHRLTGKANPHRGCPYLAATKRGQWRIDFGDGSYLLESQRERFVFNFTEPHSTLGGTTQSKATLYDADGTAIGHQTVHARLPLERAGGRLRASARFFATYAGGYAVWMIYGLSIGSLPLILVDAAGLVSGLITLAITLKMRGSLLRPSSWARCPV
jgi:hypothetical protein